MYSTSLRKVGGSTMLAIPTALLEVLQLRAGSTVGLNVDQGRLVVQPAPLPRSSLAALLAQCDASAPITAEEREWLDAKPMGRELL